MMRASHLCNWLGRKAMARSPAHSAPPKLSGNFAAHLQFDPNLQLTKPILLTDIASFHGLSDVKTCGYYSARQSAPFFRSPPPIWGASFLPPARGSRGETRRPMTPTMTILSVAFLILL